MGSGAALVFLQIWSSPPRLIELGIHFYPQWLTLWAILALCFAGVSRFLSSAFKTSFQALRWQNISFFLLLLALLLPLRSYLFPVFNFSQPKPSQKYSTTEPSVPALRIVLANVLFSNVQTASFERWLDQEQADVVIIEELNRAYEAVMHKRKADYPYHRVAYTGDPFGIGLWSRIPFEQEETLQLGPAQLPSLYVRLKTPQPVHLLATHPYPPISDRYFTDRNAQYGAITEFLAKKSGPKAVVGDLNITPWSGYYQRWEQQLGLRNTRQSQGLLGSWPVHWPQLLRIPIDHVLVSEDWSDSETVLGPDIGSDHLPLRVVIRP